MPVLARHLRKEYSVSKRWPLFVTEMHTNPGRLNCATCDSQTTEAALRNHANRKNIIAWL